MATMGKVKGNLSNLSIWASHTKRTFLKHFNIFTQCTFSNTVFISAFFEYCFFLSGYSVYHKCRHVEFVLIFAINYHASLLL